MVLKNLYCCYGDDFGVISFAFIIYLLVSYFSLIFSISDHQSPYLLHSRQKELIHLWEVIRDFYCFYWISLSSLSYSHLLLYSYLLSIFFYRLLLWLILENFSLTCSKIKHILFVDFQTSFRFSEYRLLCLIADCFSTVIAISLKNRILSLHYDFYSELIICYSYFD